MENPLKRIGFREFALKTVIFIAIGLFVAGFISLFFSRTEFFREYLTIPDDFQLEKDNLRINFINAFLFGVVAFFLLSYKKLLAIHRFPFRKRQAWFLVLAFAFLFLQYFFKYLVNQNTGYFLVMPIFWGWVKILINLGFIVVLGLAVYGIDFTKYFVKNFRKEILLFFAISFGFLFLLLLFQNLWIVFSSTISTILYSIFRLFYTDVELIPYVEVLEMTEGGGPLFRLGQFEAIIGKPCSGIDSMLLFISLYTLIVCLDYRKIRMGNAAVLFFIGAGGMFFINTIRIFILFLVGNHISRDLALGLFHTNAGWLLFIGYFFLFWWLSSKALYKP
jgi:exosortase/archaeosortase family protein